MSFTDTIRNWLWTVLTPPDGVDNLALRERIETIARYRDYYYGTQRKQIKTRPGQADDNLVLNFVQLVVERSISMMFGNGITFRLPGNPEDQNQLYVNGAWAANHQSILLHKIAQLGSLSGTCYLKIVPDAVQYKGTVYPKLVMLDPALMTIDTDTEDIDTVTRYTMRFVVSGPRGDVARKEVTERVVTDMGIVTGWKISDWYSSQGTGGRWVLDREYDWPFDFAPIVHWQNLPNAGSIYGRSDVEDIIDLQDRINFIASNISKIIRYHAHPKTWGRNVGQKTDANWGPDEMVIFTSPDATVQNLEMQSDLASSQQYLVALRQALFDIARTPDFTSVKDKLGALTNFGLRVLFQDALAKIHTKQELYGEALEEINRRMLIIANIEPADGGEVIWPEVLPSQESEQIAGLAFDLQNGLVSKQTASVARGYTWEDEQERIEEEKASADNVGAAILRAFNNGGGV